MLWGYFQKTMVADRLGEFVNTVYSNPAKNKGFIIILATIFFAFQLYCDFSSYSDMAIGAAEVMGFRLCKNFETPYFSKSIKEFWRRWHMSLTSWFKDYLYFPLRGSRCSKLRTYFNIMVVFLVSGLWHGAALNFLVWGFLHGLYQIFENILKPIREKIVKILHIRTNVFSYRLNQVLINFILVDFAWIFFRAASLRDALILIKNMIYLDPLIFIDGSLFKLGLDQLNFFMAMMSLGIVLAANLLQRKINLRNELSKQNAVFRWSLYLAAVLVIIIFGIYGQSYNPKQFIYSRF